MRRGGARAASSLDDLREAMTTLEDTERTTRRVFGGMHPLTGKIEYCLQQARSKIEAFAAP